MDPFQIKVVLKASMTHVKAACIALDSLKSVEPQYDGILEQWDQIETDIKKNFLD